MVTQNLDIDAKVRRVFEFTTMLSAGTAAQFQICSLISTGWFMNPGEVLKIAQLCTKTDLNNYRGQ
jgi:hypothetical protein